MLGSTWPVTRSRTCATRITGARSARPTRLDPAGSEYNQVINGGTYYTQEMFSNLAYDKYGTGEGCTLSEALVENLNADGLGTQPTDVVSAFAAASPNVLPANAKAISTIVVTAMDAAGDGVAGDHVYFSTGLKSGSTGSAAG